MKIKSATTAILWIVYIFLLAVLLPHTAWAFRAFEPTGAWVIMGNFTSADLVSYVGAMAFESAIAVLTHKLSTHIEQTQRAVKRMTGWAKVKERYVNAFSLGLLISTVVSSLANLAHAIEFGGQMKIFVEWGIPPAVYAIAFGGILPFVSLLFARVLSEVNESEGDEDPAVTAIKEQLLESRKAVRVSEVARQEAERARIEAERGRVESEQRYQSMGEVVRYLFGKEHALPERIRYVRRTFPQLSQNGISQVLGCSVSTVSEALKDVAEVEG